jgi:heme A synthase
MRLSVQGSVWRIREVTSTRPFFASLAVVALVSTVALIMVGSIVRVTGNGLGCPDWPLCHGRAVPPLMLSAWVEFTHRLFGGVVAALIVALIVLVRRYHRGDRWLNRTAVAITIFLSVQVALGGIHVIYELPRWTGWIHTAVAMVVAGLVAIWVAATSPGMSRLNRRVAHMLAGTRLSLWTAVGAGATYYLVLTGSLVTRTGASLVCPTFPACGLAVTPDYLKNIVLIQMTHRYSAYVVTFTVILILWHLLRATRNEPGLRRFALLLASLFALQISLGVVNVLFALPMWSRVLHLGTAATIWVIMVMLWVSLQLKDAPVAAP